MKTTILIVLGSSILRLLIVMAADASIPLATLSPPEGNTTFLGGETWCVARPASPPVDLQAALDWACGPGRADCRPIQPGGACFEPQSLVAHASYAFNSYYQQNGNNDVACYFGGTAALTRRDPSSENCAFASSMSEVSRATKLERWRRILVVMCFAPFLV